MPSFDDFGLRDPLLRALEDGDFEQPTALQEAVVPVLRREGNVVARAGSGSGKTLAYALGVLDRIQPRAGAEAAEDEGDEDGDEGEAAEAPRTIADAPGARVLVLVPTAEAAERAALALVPFVHALELSVAIPGGTWGTALDEAEVVVATAAEAMRAVRASEVKLDGLEAIVVDGASGIESLGEWESVEMLFDHVPRDAQRVVFSGEMTPGVEDLIDRRVKRALRYPSRPAVADHAEAIEARGVVGYVVVSERDKADVLARLLGGGAPPVVLCRSDERAAGLAEVLAIRGFAVGDVGDDEADVVVPSASTTQDEIREGEGEMPTVVSYDVPADERTLLARHAGDDAGYVLVEPRELAHLRDIAARAGIEARPAGVTGEDAAAGTALRAFRGVIRRALREEDLGAQMLVLEPLFEDFTAAEVAAALAALLRKRPTASAPAAESASGEGTGAAPARRATVSATHQGEEPGPPPAAFTRLFVSLGDRDGIRAGDLVGAIAGEADIPGRSIGKIEVRDTFSIVEVSADVADKVIRSVNGTTVKGRSVRVDYDRGAARAKAGGPSRGPGGSGGPRREGGPGGARRPGTGGAGGGFRGPPPGRGGDDGGRPPRRPTRD